jgi:3-oxoacyl-[acyl-carrier-protein] synthase II
VRGIGWLNEQDWGTVFRKQQVRYGGAADIPPWKNGDLFGGGIKNVGRFDRATRMTLCACALAFHDAGLSGPAGTVGLVGTNAAGSLQANSAYFMDYLQAGRVMARGNLFIYTLPSSPLAETAIHFGLQGPMLYIGFQGDGAGNLLQAGVDLIIDGAATAMVAVLADEKEGMAFLLDGLDGDRASGRLPGAGVQACARALAAGGQGLPARISELQRAMEVSDRV